MISKRVQGFTESVIREMTRINNQHNGINLAQGMPNFPPVKEIIEAAHRAIELALANAEGLPHHLIGDQLSPAERAFMASPRFLRGFDNDSGMTMLRIGSMKAVSDLGSMFAPRKVFTSIEVQGLVLPPAIVARVLWGKGSDDAMRVERVLVKGLKFELNGMALPRLDV